MAISGHAKAAPEGAALRPVAEADRRDVNCNVHAAVSAVKLFERMWEAV